MGGGSGASVVGAGDVDGGADALREREENVIGNKSVEAEKRRKCATSDM